MTEGQSGWRLNPHHVARVLRGRAVPQAPSDADQRAIRAAVAARMTPRGQSEGIPFDVLMTLEALRQLAEQGNLAAAWLYDKERRRLGIDVPSFHPAPSADT